MIDLNFCSRHRLSFMPFVFIFMIILVTEKATGKVMRIIDGKIMPNPVLDVPVAASIERGLNL